MTPEGIPPVAGVSRSRLSLGARNAVRGGMSTPSYIDRAEDANCLRSCVREKERCGIEQLGDSSSFMAGKWEIHGLHSESQRVNLPRGRASYLSIHSRETGRKIHMRSIENFEGSLGGIAWDQSVRGLTRKAGENTGEIVSGARRRGRVSDRVRRNRSKFDLRKPMEEGTKKRMWGGLLLAGNEKLSSTWDSITDEAVH